MFVCPWGVNNNQNKYKMEFKEIFSLVLPLVILSLGILIKYSKNPGFKTAKKYGTVIIITASLLFLFRIFENFYL